MGKRAHRSGRAARIARLAVQVFVAALAFASGVVTPRVLVAAEACGASAPEGVEVPVHSVPIVVESTVADYFVL